MKVTTVPHQSKDRFISAIDRLAKLVALTVALIFPLGFAGLGYTHLADRVETLAIVKAAAITELVSGNPNLWVYQGMRMEEVLARYPVPIEDETASAYDANGVLLIGAGSPPGPLLLRRSHALYDSGRVVGRIEVARSLDGLIAGTAFAALLGSLLGGVVFGIYRTWPQRALRRMGTALDSEQAALRESERRYRTLIEWSQEAMIVYRGRKVLYVNPAGIKLFGKSSAQEMAGKSIQDFIHPDCYQMALARVKSIVDDGVNPPMAEMKFLKLDGTAIDGEVQSTAIEFDGKPAICSCIRDITERKQATMRLAAAQRRSTILAQLGRELAEAATPKAAAIHILGAAQQLFKWDAGWLQLWDEPRQKMEGLAYFDFIDGEIRDVSSDTITPPTPTPLVRSVMEGGEQLLLFESDADMGAIGRLYGGRLRPLSVMVVPIELADRLIGIISIQDYQRHAYDQADLDLLQTLAAHCAGALVRLQSVDALRASEERFQLVNRAVFNVIRDEDLANDVIWWSDNFATVYGYDRHEATHNAAFWRGCLHPEDRERVVARLSVLYESDADNWSENYRFRRKDGSYAFVEDRALVVRNAAGQPVRMLGAMQEVSEQKQAEAAHTLLEMQLRESQKMEAIGTLAGGIAHDFNNILATILGNTELARQDLGNNPRALESLEEIRKAGSRARDLVQQILSFSRRQPTDRQPTALGPVVEESARLLRATLPARLILRTHCDADVPPVLADATQMQQALINLVNNAVQAMRGEPMRIGIRLDTTMLDGELAGTNVALRALHENHPGRTVRLAVSDDGPGMDAATLGRIFEPFFTTKPVDEGTGLGLSVVHGIVKSHEGAIVVDSEPGLGATFTIYLPAAEGTAEVPVLVPIAVADAASPSESAGRHILYIDDDESLVFLVSRLLERRGLRISGFTDQREALNLLRADPTAFDLVVTDYNMPGMSGLEVAREVRTIRADLPVAVASGFIDETLRAQAEGAGVRELIFKASAVEELCEAFVRLAQIVGNNAESV